MTLSNFKEDFAQENIESQPTFSCYLMGSESLLIKCAELLLEKGHHICGIISSEPQISEWAAAQEIPSLKFDTTLADVLRQQPFDYFFSIANLAIVPDEILMLPRRGAINFHDGPLPRYAGLHATSWALINREQEHGITWHIMSHEVDKGQILKQQRFPIAENETAFTLNVKCYEAAIASFDDLIDRLAEDRVEPQPQNLVEQTYFGKYQRPTAACTLRWSQPATEIQALVQALNFGPYENPLGLPKLYTEQGVFIVNDVTVHDSHTSPAPGTIVALDEEGITVASGAGYVVLHNLQTDNGQSLSVSAFAAQENFRVGDRLPVLIDETSTRLTELHQTLSRSETFWRRRLANLSPVSIPYARHNQGDGEETALTASIIDLPSAVIAKPDAADLLVAAFAAYIARISGNNQFDLGLSDQALTETIAGFEPYFATTVPLRINLNPSDSAAATLDSVRDQLARTRKRKTYARDILLRYPELEGLREGAQPSLPISLGVVTDWPAETVLSGSELEVYVVQDGGQMQWVYDPNLLDRQSIERMQGQFITFLNQLIAEPTQPLGAVSLLTEEERRQLLVTWNDTGLGYPKQACIHHLFEAQVEQTPHAVAVVFEDQELTYQELNTRANQLAHHLRKRQVGPETRVGIYMDRSLDMMVSLFGVLKAGAAYVPLDPTYPDERIAFMVEDAELPVLLTQEDLLAKLPPHHAQVICVDSDWNAIARERTTNPESGVTPKNLSYVIYTSGSTGKPKGVMVGHQNVVNFFAGMDERIPHDSPGVWLAVTTLSFDISVLELFWTLARGFKVILQGDKFGNQPVVAQDSVYANKSIDFSLFYFSSDEGEQEAADNKYKLLLEGAKFGDAHGFAAVWTPERHFHAFGGLYPNPSVAGAAIATVTEKIGIRAGSCVLPLHSPIRVAEEWALVDNLSQGRVGLSVAAGWQPNDFVLKPENHADRKEIMFRDTEVVQRLWRGESVDFPGPTGNIVSVRTLPRPVQPELPIWVTIAGNPETYQMAGEGGYHVLTHLLGQSVEELAEKLAIYRAAWEEAGHPGRGQVALMLHTFVGDNIDSVREIVRKPMTDYLRSAVSLVRDAAWHFPTFKRRAEESGKDPLELLDSEDITEEDMEALLNFAFERYFETSGLFGTPDSCLTMVNQLKAIDVDDIACLIDFGVGSETVLNHLGHLKTLKELANPGQNNYSMAAQIKRHGVTHLQGTPSLVSMLLMDEAAREGLGQLQALMVGGEAFPVALADELRELVSGQVINMYGPTETTIWSSTYALNGAEKSVSIGRPIANTSLYILDSNLEPVPTGVAGELYIGGDGVVRGYLNRPELTAERFVKDPFNPSPNARLYRTGDLVRYRPDGNIEFLGRMDHQVKIRGYRIELGEIETRLNQHPALNEGVVVAREDATGNSQLVAYVVPGNSSSPPSNELRDFLMETLPEFMVPAAFVTLDVFPLTPNGKVDRRALPDPGQTGLELDREFVAPRTPVEEILSGVWADTLAVKQIGVHDNFFELGGHSLLAIQLISQLRDLFMVELPLYSLFEIPTVAGLTQALHHYESTPGQVEKVVEMLQKIEAMSDAEVSQLLQ